MTAEAITGGDSLIIVGSGNVAWNVYKIAAMLGYQVTVIDNRADTLTGERFPNASQLLLGDAISLLGGCEITETTSIVLASSHHEFDLAALCELAGSPARYIGALGNKRKVTAYFAALEAMSVPPEWLERLHVPIGLDIGGHKAAEIALSIMAEIQSVKYNRPGGFVVLQERRKGIAERDELF
ncbi:MAG: XdhC family protein [Syntrophomonadaceae bacterium]